MDERPYRKGDDQQARRNPQPLPTDPFLEAALERGQKSLHSSSRQGDMLQSPFNISIERGGRSFPISKFHKAKTPRCAVLDNAAIGLDGYPLSDPETHK